MAFRKKRNNREPRGIRARLRQWYAQSDRDWKVDRFAFWPGITILTLLAVAYFNGGMADPLDFTVQAWTIGLLTVGLGGVGLSVGYKRPFAKNLWTTADIVWLFTAIFALGSSLSSAESYFAGQNLERARLEVVAAHKKLASAVHEASDLDCPAGQQDAPACAAWTGFQRTLLLPVASMTDVSAISDKFKQIHDRALAVGAGRDIYNLQRDLYCAQKKYDELKAPDKSDFVMPYVYIFLISLALGFRAATSGAELARNRIERNNAARQHPSAFFSIRRRTRRRLKSKSAGTRLLTDIAALRRASSKK